MEKFCKSLPKIASLSSLLNIHMFNNNFAHQELHAHLNGSLSKATLLELGCKVDNVKGYQKLATILEKSSRSLDDSFHLFDIAHNATNSPDALYTATTNVIKEFDEDNCIYLELRTTPRTAPHMSYEDYILAVLSAICNNQRRIIVKLILCLNRNFSEEQNEEVTNVIISLHSQYKDIIVGIDLCGNPKVGYFPKETFAKARNAGLKVTLHCGEVKADGEELEMLEFMPDRIGHGTFLHPKRCNQKMAFDVNRLSSIPLEMCLTSNFVTGTVESYESHHIKEWMEHNLPFCLCTDDKGVFGCDLSKEFFLAHQFYKLSANDLYNLSFKTVDYIFAGDSIKNQLKSYLKQWEVSNEKILN